MKRVTRLLHGGLAAVAIVAAPTQADTLDLFGHGALRSGWLDSEPSWLSGGYGRLPGAAEDARGGTAWARGDARIGLRWEPAVNVQALVHGRVRLGTEDEQGRELGLTEAWIEWRRAIAGPAEVRVKAGQFFYPSSQENTAPLWASRYTLSYSAINSWMGEEVRPVGVDVAWQRYIGDRRLELAATAFGGNDTMGTLLAWRGWTLHNRLTVTGETLPVASSFLFDPQAPFAPQQDAGTRPFGNDLDGRVGWAARAGWQGRSLDLQAAWMDNRGDRDLHDGEYAWDTRFLHAGFTWRLGDRLELLGELVDGRTTMGFRGAPWVDADLSAAYLMASWHGRDHRISLRHDRFEISDRLRVPAWTVIDDDGHAWALAWLQEFEGGSRLGAELLWVEGDHPAAASAGSDPDNGGWKATLEWRYRF